MLAAWNEWKQNQLSDLFWMICFQMSPSFLNSNSTSHTWPFSAVAELIGRSLWRETFTVVHLQQCNFSCKVRCEGVQQILVSELKWTDFTSSFSPSTISLLLYACQCLLTVWRSVLAIIMLLCNDQWAYCSSCCRFSPCNDHNNPKIKKKKVVY